ncbi:pilus assembly protein PilM [Burkholderia sp. WAC0059]|uniref:type IV pilus biogenesis protein PilM n=1 Tax=Burkholderia sp. WAC0059 TaxID=2066022 RepID=UPI000C7EC6B9|nr:pilus assembly protein PilM [Burkholderia sp. WAC0059]PLZ01341.1 pilus assembly protein PilM [Burkholderia sp. WAC0059]
MGSGNAMGWGRRRLAAGLDVNAAGVTAVVLSRRWHGGGPARIEWLAAVPLAHGAMAGAQIVDRDAVAGALRAVFDGLPRECAKAAHRCAMALPASATLATSVPLAQFAYARPAGDDDAILAGLEPMVLAEAERAAGVERHELVVDWRVDAAVADVSSLSPTHGDDLRERRVTITAAPRQHLEARLECAAAAGVGLYAMDGEPHAALRAMRYAAALELSPREPCVALWLGADGVYGWYLRGSSVVREMRYPALEHADLVEALRDLPDGSPVRCALISGDIGMLEAAHVSLADLGRVLGCLVLPFECATLDATTRQPSSPLLHDPACAVAFGLALRGVSE